MLSSETNGYCKTLEHFKGLSFTALLTLRRKEASFGGQLFTFVHYGITSTEQFFFFKFTLLALFKYLLHYYFYKVQPITITSKQLNYKLKLHINKCYINFKLFYSAETLTINKQFEDKTEIFQM